MTPTATPASPAMFACPKLRMRLSESGCARMFLSTIERRPAPHEGRHNCIACPIGARHAGAGLSPMAAVVERLRAVCPRCRRPAERIISGHVCVSCYNREREARIGRNAKGNMPLIAAQLGPRRITVTTATETRIVEQVATGLPELMLAAAKMASGAVSFGRPPADLTGSAA